ncbi:exodeoxyribonuclease VII large subunit [Methanomethylovorans sp. PtaU1.Bin093]|jgi:exodeoxyribonuclease VII large subunit|uniref:exodeoxyribonuclease VII large subunit n=1 Tax=Methanomethylovorans sp. PtaU1.Bin093 TaxID=1811679 RepID=UPI0025DE58C9|nr:exodeoxyribonuclease VII large subunit [Methanomethylovorans sp. PtaU1.Bin093]
MMSENPMGIFSVSMLNETIRSLLVNDPRLREVWVRGEISNLKKHSSGHYYFTLKDRGSQISCVSFRQTNRSLKFDPEDSMSVILYASVDVYTVRGQYQLKVLDMRPDGIGEMFRAFEQLKKKLEAEGLFEQSRKRPIPRFPSRIGISTSPTGAAIHDVINVLSRRYPVHVLLAPCLVQGDAAAQSIADSIGVLNKADVDVIIVGRGGGSLEDLWPFNEEVVARAIFNSRIPVISAVGHETDYTIADFTADMRAPTPSAAAELVVPDRVELKRFMDSMLQRLEYAATRKIADLNSRLDHLYDSLEPDKLREMIDLRYQRIDELVASMEKDVNYGLGSREMLLRALAGRMNAVNPLNTLERGYCIAMSDGAVVRSVDDVQAGSRLDLRVTDGTIICDVTEKVEIENGTQEEEDG